MRAPALAALVAALALPALAAPDVSLRPEARPGAAATISTSSPAETFGRLFRPEGRAAAPRPAPGGLASSLRPPGRPADLKRGINAAFAPADASGLVARGPGGVGGICGVPGLGGTTGRSIAGKLNGCGLTDGVQITSVEGIALTQGASMDCTTAKALHSWVMRSAKPAMGARGGGIKSIKVAAGYACRTRNSRKGARISEHGKGRAIDVSGFVLRDGTDVTVLRGWRDPTYGPILKAMHRDACGPFKTVLGPAADRFHQDHFHFDTARRMNGSSYCR